jgi:tyrosine-protein phosphatase YwqE
MTKILNHGIPQRIIRDTQAFQLVALIDGAAANTQFINNLQVLGQQRKVLSEIRQRVAALPASATVEERAALQAQALQLDNLVTKNVQFMTQHYGYSLDQNYLLNPVDSALLKKAVDENGKPIEDEAKATVAAELQTFEAYDAFQALRQRAQDLGGDESKKSDYDAVKAELLEKYAFDVDSHYILQVRKGALYATVPAAA